MDNRFSLIHCLFLNSINHLHTVLQLIQITTKSANAVDGIPGFTLQH